MYFLTGNYYVHARRHLSSFAPRCTHLVWCYQRASGRADNTVDWCCHAGACCCSIRIDVYRAWVCRNSKTIVTLRLLLIIWNLPVWMFYHISFSIDDVFIVLHLWCACHLKSFGGLYAFLSDEMFHLLCKTRAPHFINSKAWLWSWGMLFVWSSRYRQRWANAHMYTSCSTSEASVWAQACTRTAAVRNHHGPSVQCYTYHLLTVLTFRASLAGCVGLIGLSKEYIPGWLFRFSMSILDAYKMCGCFNDLSRGSFARRAQWVWLPWMYTFLLMKTPTISQG